LKNLPFFLYGTLRPGCVRHGVIASSAEKLVSGTLSGVAMYYVPQGGFPYIDASESAEDKIVGEVCYVKPDRFEGVLADLDAIEGYAEGSNDSFFERKTVTVQTEDGDVECICYFGGTIKQYARGERVPSGDFKDC